jgi:hypothetical protein
VHLPWRSRSAHAIADISAIVNTISFAKVALFIVGCRF